MGHGGSGRLGNGNGTHQFIPVKITDDIRVSCGDGHSLFVKNNGSLWTVGSNNSGQLGDGTTTRDPYLLKQSIKMSPCHRVMVILHLLKMMPHFGRGSE